MTNLLINWRTSSAGLIVILTGLVHLLFAFKNKSFTETDTITTLTTIVTGIGLVVSRDSKASDKAIQQHEATVADIKTQLDATTAAVKTGDTSILRKSDIPSAEPPKG